MAVADVDGNQITIAVEYRERDLVRRVPGAKWQAISKRWHVPLAWANCLALRGVFGERLELTDALVAWAQNELDERITPALTARAAALDPDADTDGDPRLRPYQRTGVAFLKVAGSAILADDMGTGKTVQTLMTLEELDAWPALIVAPKNVKAVWASEVEKWLPHRSLTVVASGAKKAAQLAAETDITVVNWDLLRTASRLAPYGSVRLTPEQKQDKELNRPWGAVVADEAHRGKDPKAVQTRALWAVAAWARHRFALTGTPISDAPDDYWSLLHFVNAQEWPRRTVYIDRYCDVSHNYWGGVDINGLRADTKDEFMAATQPRMIRRPKALVLPQLPAKTYITRWVEMSAKQAKAYKQMKKDQVAEITKGGLIAAFDPLTVNTRLSQFASAYCERGPAGVVMSEPSSKVDSLVELLEEMNNDPLVVFASNRQLIDLADARLTKLEIPHGRITGAENEAQRTAAKDRFQAGEDRVILCTFGAGSEGTTLTRADTTCFMQRPYNAVHNKQAEDRTHRIGQESDKVVIIDMIAPNTVEELSVIPNLAGKAERMEEIVQDKTIIARYLGLKEEA